MKILTDEDVYIPDADVWDDMPINGSNWRLVKKIWLNEILTMKRTDF